jgi:hypothetical protein
MREEVSKIQMIDQTIRQYVETASLNAAKRSIIKNQLERNQRKLYKIKRKIEKKTRANATFSSQQDRPKFSTPKPVLEGMSVAQYCTTLRAKIALLRYKYFAVIAKMLVAHARSGPEGGHEKIGY